MAKIRFWKWQYTDPLGKEHVMRAPLSRPRVTEELEYPQGTEWSLPLGEREQQALNDLSGRAPK
jgi:hypothetical protein